MIGQALARQSHQESEEYPTLSAVGMQRRQLFALGQARNLGLAAVGALGAVVIATLLSPVAPLGEARIAAPGGVRFDTFVLPLGALVVVAIVLALGVWPAFSAAARTRTTSSADGSRSSVLTERLAALGARPSMVIGVRNALERRSGGSSVPVGSALVGTVVAVVALCGTAVFGSSLTHLLATPSLYGDPYSLNLTNPSTNITAPPPTLVRSLRADPAVTGVTEGFALPAISIDGQTVGAIAGTPLKGRLLISTVSGHLPTGAGQVDLGAVTMRDVGAHLGSSVRVSVSLPSGAKRTSSYVVVGQASLPVLGDVVGLGTGSVFTLNGYLSAACPAGPTAARCRQAELGNGGGLLVSVASGSAGRAAIAHYLAVVGPNAATPLVPTSLINFGEAVNFPAIFGVMLAVFGAATLLHLLVVSVARRRREVGLLKVVGFVDGQVASSVAWQATTLALIGIVVGVPLGIAAGEAVWRAFANNLGAVPVAVVPTWLIVVLAAAVVAVANVVAIGPALVATRSRPSELLRTA